MEALPLNRREMLGVIGTAGAVAAVASSTTPAQADHVHAAVQNGCVRGKMNGAQASVAALCCERVRCVFGVPGAQTNEFWDAMKTYGLPYLLVTNEASSSVMADSAARVTGEVGVFSVVPGPGLTNAMTGIGEALLDSVPIVALVTDVDRRPGAPVGQVHSLSNTALLRPITKGVFEVHHVSEIPGAISQAFRLARAGEPGPTAVVIPYPFLTQSWDFDFAPPPPAPLCFDEAAYRGALAMLGDKRRRVGIYAGQGCVNAGTRLDAVAELLQAPVATSVSGKGVIADHHRLAVGWGYGKQGTPAAEAAFKDVDLVLAVGVRFSEVSTANYSLPIKPLIHVDANPHNLNRNFPANVAVNADAPLFLDRLLADGASVARPACPPLWQKIKAARTVDRCNYRQPQIDPCVDPMYLLSSLRDALGPDELFFVDVTASTHWASEAIELPGPRRYFAPANNQSMGWAIPASIAAQRVSPGSRVVCVTGDGCFLMSGMEMSTAARAGLPVKFFVLEDGAYHYMQMLQEPVYRRTTATELAHIDYAAFAAAMGLAYNPIFSNAEVGPGIGRALATPAPVLTHVKISYDGREIRWLSALKGSYLKKLSTDQKVRMAGRVAVRSLDRHPESD
ncbi:thiamine pyrophosphate-binding protein [Isosphaeraceae bacterium EP7]